MCGSVVEVEVSFLDTLAMVSLRIAQTEQTLFQKVILLVPEGKGDVLDAVSVRDASNAVLAPSVSSGSCLVMREVTPSISVLRVVFSNGGPLAFSNVGTPFLPVLCPLAIFFQTLLLLTEILVVVDDDHGCRC